jgi:LytS/YehU family sensor histidine kinase
VGVQEVPLRKELEFLERYLEIERTRFADRLTVEMEIAPETLDARTPYLILQPLVENAIRHGIAPRARAGRIGVRARRDNGMLRLEVSDNGPGITAGAPGDSRKGLGLASTRARLERLYGAGHRFEMSNRLEGGLVVTLAIPFEKAQTEPGEDAGAGQ